MKIISHIINTYKKHSLFNKSYYSRHSYYTTLTDQYSDFSEYSRIIDLYKKKEISKTNKIITIQKDQLFNINNKKNITKKIKDPQFKSKIKKNNLDIEIYFYKIIIGGNKVRLELHLNKKKMFYYNYTFSNYLNNQQYQNIIKIIQEKYLDGLSIDTDRQSIVDQHKTVLNIENTIELKIHYISTSSDIIQTLSTYKESCANKKLKSIEKNHNELRNIL